MQLKKKNLLQPLLGSELNQKIMGYNQLVLQGAWCLIVQNPLLLQQ